MWLQLVNVLYVLVAIAMIGLILMQRGSGAQAGSGFGGGASATVFGSRGASNFLSTSTKWLAIAFFAISLLAFQAKGYLFDPIFPAAAAFLWRRYSITPGSTEMTMMASTTMLKLRLINGMLPKKKPV